MPTRANRSIRAVGSAVAAVDEDEGVNSRRRAAAATAGSDGGEPDPRRWRILAVSQVAGFMSLLDVSIVNVALPSIQSGLGASAGGGCSSLRLQRSC